MAVACQICGSERTQLLAARGETPIFQNGLFESAAAARACAKGPLEMRSCLRCGFVWNARFDLDLIDYAAGYDNQQGHSAEFRAHLASRRARIAEAAEHAAEHAAGDRVELLDIGCGQGDFLADLRGEIGPERISRAVGVDPAWRGDEREGLELIGAYFGAETAARHGLAPDIVTSRHVIEHIPEPRLFLTALRQGLTTDKPVKLFLETPTADWILRGRVQHDFFYEHCSLFTPGSMAIALEAAGFAVGRVETCFGGQYLWAEAEAAGGADAEAFAAETTGYVARWREAAARFANPVVWGAGAKGATFALLVDPEARLIRAVIDINPVKQGHFIPATGHPILPPAELVETPPDAVFVMNPNYQGEIRDWLAGQGMAPEILIVE